MNIVYLGGSSIHFRNAFQAALESIWHSSIIKHLYSKEVDLSFASATIVLTLSTPLLDAPSISIAELSELFNLRINALAAVVFPHPDAPQKR